MRRLASAPTAFAPLNNFFSLFNIMIIKYIFFNIS